MTATDDLIRMPAGPALSAETKAALEGISTATIATLLFRHGLRNQFIQGVGPLNPGRPRMVGPAFTLRHIPAREDLDVLEAFRDPRHPQRVAVEAVPEGFVLVMDCRRDATCASAGSILATRLSVRGCAGLVSDAGVRDAETIAALPMPTFCAGASAPTNLTRHHALEMNVPVGCGGVPVYPGDVIVGDRDGVMVVPAHLVDQLVAEGPAMEAFEDFALLEMAAGRPVIGTYPANDETRARYVRYQAGDYTPGDEA